MPVILADDLYLRLLKKRRGCFTWLITDMHGLERSNYIKSACCWCSPRLTQALSMCQLCCLVDMYMLIEWPVRQRQCQHNTHKFNTTGRNINTYIDSQPSGGGRRRTRLPPAAAAPPCCKHLWTAAIVVQARTAMHACTAGCTYAGNNKHVTCALLSIVWMWTAFGSCVPAAGKRLTWGTDLSDHIHYCIEVALASWLIRRSKRLAYARHRVQPCACNGTHALDPGIVARAGDEGGTWCIICCRQDHSWWLVLTDTAPVRTPMRWIQRGWSVGEPCM
jgi:hypothetical protein